MAYFLPCPHCHQAMPRAAKTCPHCRLTLEQALERSEQPEEEKPPVELYFHTHAGALRPEQKLPVGFLLFLSLMSLLKPAPLSTGILFVTGLLWTPALQQRLPFRLRLWQGLLLTLGAMLLAWALF